MKWECFFCGMDVGVTEEAASQKVAGACGHCEVNFVAKEGPLLEFIKSLGADKENDDVERNSNQ